MYAQTGKTLGRIIIPDTAKEEVFFAQVVKAGPGKVADVDDKGQAIRMPMHVGPGDNILFMRYHGERLEIDGSYYLLLRQDDVLSKIKMPKPAPNEYFVFASTGVYDDESLKKARAT
jgi:co-chaperonin GroES (HSP10)